jgi:hypothetical protein
MITLLTLAPLILVTVVVGFGCFMVFDAERRKAKVKPHKMH